MKREVCWKLSDTVAAVFFGIWFFSMLFRPFFGGLDILILIVAAIWAASLWARKQGEEPPVPLTKEQKENLKEMEYWQHQWRTNPAFSDHPGNAHYRHDD